MLAPGAAHCMAGEFSMLACTGEGVDCHVIAHAGPGATTLRKRARGTGLKSVSYSSASSHLATSAPLGMVALIPMICAPLAHCHPYSSQTGCLLFQADVRPR